MNKSSAALYNSIRATNSAAHSCNIISHLDGRSLREFCKCIKHVVHGKARLGSKVKDNVRRALLPHKKDFLTLADPKIGLATKRRLIQKRARHRGKGFFLPALAGFLPLVLDLLFKKKKK